MKFFRLILALPLGLAACNLAGPTLATTAALENGASTNLASAKSLELKGSFAQSTDKYAFDYQFTAPTTIYQQDSKNGISFEAFSDGTNNYIRGHKFIASELGSSATDQRIAQAIGDRWFKPSDASSPDVSWITNNTKFKATFLDNVVTKRTDNVDINGVKSAQLTSGDYEIDISESTPYRYQRIKSLSGKVVDGMSDATMDFSNWNKTFSLPDVTGFVDANDGSTLPPSYSVESIDTSHCFYPCKVSAVLKNRGGLNGATAHSVAKFDAESSPDGASITSCTATVSPDVAYSQTTTVGCTLSGSAWDNFSGTYQIVVTVDNPAYDVPGASP